MLEHLPESEVLPTLSELRRVSSRFIFSISYVDSVTKWKGQTLHPTVRPEEWWIDRIMQAGGLEIARSDGYLHGRWGEPLRLEGNVILVGNGPSVLGHKLGKVVDSFEEVVRFNNFQTKGFEEHVGGKTTLWVAVPQPNEPIRHSRLLCQHEKKDRPEGITEFNKIPSWFFWRTHREFQSRVGMMMGFDKATVLPKPTSGLLTVLYFLRVLRIEKVYLLGFDHFSKDKSKQHHYWVPGAFSKPKEHNGDIESAILKELAEKGRVVVL